MFLVFCGNVFTGISFDSIFVVKGFLFLKEEHLVQAISVFSSFSTDELCHALTIDRDRRSGFYRCTSTSALYLKKTSLPLRHRILHIRGEIPR